MRTKRFYSNSFPCFLATFHGPVSLLYLHLHTQSNALPQYRIPIRILAQKGKRSRHSFSNDAKRLSSIILENAPFRWCDSRFQTEGSIVPSLPSSIVGGGGGSSLIKRPWIKRRRVTWRIRIKSVLCKRELSAVSDRAILLIVRHLVNWISRDGSMAAGSMDRFFFLDIIAIDVKLLLNSFFDCSSFVEYFYTIYLKESEESFNSSRFGI